MDNTKGKSLNTEDIAKNIDKGEPVPDAQEWNDTNATEDRNQIAKDIKSSYKSRFQFATEASISASHLSEFLTGEKQMSRDNLLRMFLCLGYDLKTVNRYLMHINGETLYVRKRRDYLIADAINNGLTLVETDTFLLENDEEGLIPKE